MSDHASLVAEIARLREAAREAEKVFASIQEARKSIFTKGDCNDTTLGDRMRPILPKVEFALTALRNAIKGDVK